MKIIGVEVYLNNMQRYQWRLPIDTNTCAVPSARSRPMVGVDAGEAAQVAVSQPGGAVNRRRRPLGHSDHRGGLPPSRPRLAIAMNRFAFVDGRTPELEEFFHLWPASTVQY